MLQVPSNPGLAGAAPLLCAGITTYSPMRRWGVSRGKKVDVVGPGGLGHVAVKIAHALRLGAGEVVLSRNAGEMQKLRAVKGASAIETRRAETVCHTLAGDRRIRAPA